MEREEALTVALHETPGVGLRQLGREGRRWCALLEEAVKADIVVHEPLDVAERVPGGLHEVLADLVVILLCLFHIWYDTEIISIFISDSIIFKFPNK